MEIISTVPAYDPRTHRMAATFTDLVDDERGLIARTFDVEAIPVEDVLPALVERIKAEAYRRITDLAPEWRQRNLTARAVELVAQHAGRPVAEWPEPDRTEWAAGEAVWTRIKAIRRCSDELEAALATAESATDAWAVVEGAQWEDDQLAGLSGGGE